MIKGKKDVLIRRNLVDNGQSVWFFWDLCANQNSYSSVVKVKEGNELSWRGR